MPRYPLAFVTSGLVSAIVAGSAIADGFTRGHIYAPGDGGFIYEYDTDLNLVNTIKTDFSAATGAVFNDRGNLVTVAKQSDGTKVLEIDGNGKIISNYDTGYNALARGSEVDFNSATGKYAVANRHEVTILDSTFNFSAESNLALTRASGIAYGPDGILFAADQLGGTELFTLNEDLLPINVSFLGGGPSGMDYASDGFLYVSHFGDGEIRRIDTETYEQEVIIDGLGAGNVSDVELLPGGNLLVSRYGDDFNIFSPGGQILASALTPSFHDSLTYYIPAPSALGVWAFLMVRRRRRGGCRVICHRHTAA